MQSTVLAMSATTATPSPARMSLPLPSTTSLPATGQLGPTPAIPTLKQLQDHHIKAKHVTPTSNNNNNSNTNNNNVTANNNNAKVNNNNGHVYKPLILRKPTVPPVVLKLTGDPADQAAKRTYSVTSPLSASDAASSSASTAEPDAATLSEPPAKKARSQMEEADARNAKIDAVLSAVARPLPETPHIPDSTLSLGASMAPVNASMIMPGVLPGVMPGVLHYPPAAYLAGLPCPPPGSPLAPLIVAPPRPPSGPPSSLSPGLLAGPPRPPSAGPSRPPSAGPARPPSGGPSRPPSTGPSRPPSAGPSRPPSAGSSRPSTSGSSRAPHSSPLRGKHRAIRQQTMEENREGLLDCVKHVPESFQAVLRQHIMLQLHMGRTQASMGSTIVASLHKAEMISSYQPWVILTYGDAAKTKTITLAKYARIVRTLRGEEVNSAENSKFRFWVRSKGFRLGAPDPDGARKPADDIVGSYNVDTRTGHLYICADEAGHPASPVDAPPLYVPTGTNKEDDGRSVPVYKRVAVVENFFDIIYSVHVDIEGRGNKHAGQKRTYRTITDSYAFLPREAVTRFLLGCTECNRRPRSPASPTRTTAAAVVVKDTDEDSFPDNGTGPSQRSTASSNGSGSPPPSPAPSLSPGPSPSAGPLLSPGAATVSRLHALPPAEHASLFKRYADPSTSRASAESSTVAGGLLSHTFPVLPPGTGDAYSSPLSSPATPSSLDHHTHFSFSPAPSSSPSPLSRPAGSVSILSGRSGPSAFKAPAEAQGQSNGQPGDDPRTTSPALAEGLLPALREDKGESLFKLPHSPHSIFLHSASGRKTDVSLTPLSPKEQSDKLANSPFSIQNISKSSRSSPTPPDTDSPLFAVPEPPKPRSPPKVPDDTFLVPKPPRPRSTHHLLKQPLRAQSPVGNATPTDSPLLRPLETVAPRDAVPVDQPSPVCMPYPVRPVPLPAPRPPSSILAGFEPAAGSGLLNLLLKSGVLRNRGPRTAIPNAGEIDLSLPITTTYLKHMRSLGYTDEDALQIDVEMSLYQHVLGVPLKIIDDYL